MSSSGIPDREVGRSIRIGVAMKWVSRHVELDPFTGAIRTDPRLSGASDADLAALEWGLRLAEGWSGEVVVATAGPPEANAMLRGALAAGAHRAVRCDLHFGAHSDAVAVALGEALSSVDLVVCGDRSADRGSGSVPAFLAARLGVAQSLGLVALEPRNPGELLATRRLDGGRRERLRVMAPAVISVEASTARLRRASLSGVLRSGDAPIDLLRQPMLSHAADYPGGIAPYRPRSRAIPIPDPQLPALGRILAITGALGERKRSELLVLEPAAAAERILAQLREWGYLE